VYFHTLEAAFVHVSSTFFFHMHMYADDEQSLFHPLTNTMQTMYVIFMNVLFIFPDMDPVINASSINCFPSKSIHTIFYTLIHGLFLAFFHTTTKMQLSISHCRVLEAKSKSSNHLPLHE
jgi:hypothetical protein